MEKFRDYANSLKLFVKLANGHHIVSDYNRVYILQLSFVAFEIIQNKNIQIAERVDYLTVMPVVVNVFRV